MLSSIMTKHMGVQRKLCRIVYNSIQVILFPKSQILYSIFPGKMTKQPI